MQQESVIKLELDWLEKKFKEMRDTIDATPMNKIDDRKEMAFTPKGIPYEKIVATREQQWAAYQKLLKEIFDILPKLKQLREENQAANIEMKGGAAVNSLMKRKMGQISDV